MAKKLTGKEEKYCQLRAIKGYSQADAYKEAYNAENMKDNTIYVKASELEKNGKISVRIKELTEKKTDKLAEKITYGIKECNDELEEIRILALSKKNHLGDYEPDLTNATKAVVAKMRLFGLDTQKQEITGNLDIQKIFISPEEHDATLKHIEDVINDKP